MEAICVEGLCKSFQLKKKSAGFGGSVKALIKPQYVEKSAVEPITFRVEQGETLAFLGPNGAGKSTTIKMLTGILHPSGGEASVLGLKPWKDRKKLAYRIGSVFGQKSQLWYHLPPVDSFELMSRIYELKRADFLQRRDDLVSRFELEPYLHVPVRKLSLGERMRCEIAAALLHRPQIVFLDEPTIGLDVIVKKKIRELITHLNREEGTTIFLTSHDAGDIEKLCKRAIVINHGRLILDDDVAVMKKDLLTHKAVRLELQDAGMPPAMAGVEVTENAGSVIRLSVDTARQSMESVLEQLVRHCRLSDVTIEDPPMEEIIAHIYARNAGEGEARQGFAAKGRVAGAIAEQAHVEPSVGRTAEVERAAEAASIAEQGHVESSAGHAAEAERAAEAAEESGREGLVREHADADMRREDGEPGHSGLSAAAAEPEEIASGEETSAAIEAQRMAAAKQTAASEEQRQPASERPAAARIRPFIGD